LVAYPGDKMIKFFSLHKALTMHSLRIAGYISYTLVSFTTGNRRDCILLWISPLILQDAEEIKIYMRVYYTYCRGRQNIAETYRAFSDSYFTVTRVYHHFHFVPALVTSWNCLEISRLFLLRTVPNDYIQASMLSVVVTSNTFCPFANVALLILKYVSCVIVILWVITVGIEQHDVIIEGQSRDITVDFVGFSFKFS
jgi:hypothetical protein